MKPATATHRAAIVDEALVYMREHRGKDLGIDDVARALSVSRRSLQRAFGDAGLGYRAELRRLRCERAAELLADPYLTVRTIARTVGYRQPSQFARAFARELGAPPSEYRARAA